ncbi:MAG: 50S ribosomal protein L11 methyltransferase [Chitinophagales bacterium]|nr:50S ribosomal protein L11 methyltransferase [Chitinophagales bacterium]
MQYLAFEFALQEEWQKDIIIVALNQLEFVGFEEKEESFIAYISINDFKEEAFGEFITRAENIFPVSYLKTEIADQNWNALWEKNFPPIVIDNTIAIRASFHNPFPEVKYEILIDPKMSFGTGHHATTFMMLELMVAETFDNKSVLDFGCGTGILSVLASKKNAFVILAVDNDQWAFQNATENFVMNGVTNAEIVLGDHAAFADKTFDVILANINLNVIIDALHSFALSLKKNGSLLISGFLEHDESAITTAAAAVKLSVRSILHKDGWAAMRFILEE